MRLRQVAVSACGARQVCSPLEMAVMLAGLALPLGASPNLKAALLMGLTPPLKVAPSLEVEPTLEVASLLVAAKVVRRGRRLEVSSWCWFPAAEQVAELVDV